MARIAAALARPAVGPARARRWNARRSRAWADAVAAAERKRARERFSAAAADAAEREKRRAARREADLLERDAARRERKRAAEAEAEAARLETARRAAESEAASASVAREIGRLDLPGAPRLPGSRQATLGAAAVRRRTSGRRCGFTRQDACAERRGARARRGGVEGAGEQDGGARERPMGKRLFFRNRESLPASPIEMSRTPFTALDN